MQSIKTKYAFEEILAYSQGTWLVQFSRFGLSGDNISAPIHDRYLKIQSILREMN